MKKSVIAISVIAMIAMLPSCGKKKSALEEAISKAEKNKTALHVQVGPSPETIDPALNSAVDGANMILHSFEGLLKFDRDNNIVAGLAESWEQSDDGLTWTFHLRPNLKWSDGSALTAEDFVYSWKRVADPATAAPYGYDLLNMVVGFDKAEAGDVDALGVEAPDANTFVVHLTDPCIYFDKIAAFAVLVPVQKATVEANGESWTINPETYVTDGPYFMAEFTDGSRIVFQKNPYYWDADNITFDFIIWHLIEDPNTSYTAYNQGTLQMIKDVPTEEIPSLRGSSQFYSAPIMGTYYVTFNVERKPFNDPRVREALSLAIDRKHVANVIMQGTYIPAKNFVGPGVSDAAPGSSFEEYTTANYGDYFDVENYEADLEKAKKLLAEAGYPGGKGFPAFEYLTNDSLYHKPVAEYLQSAYSQLGITMKINIQEWKTVTADRRSGNFDVARNGWVYDWDDPSNMINLLETGNGNNDGKYSSKAFDDLVRKARATVNVADHYKYLHEAEQVLLKDAAMAPVAYYNEVWMQVDNLKDTWHSPYGYWYFMYGKLE